MTTEQATEEELLCAAQQGDYDAFELLYHRLQPDVARFVTRLIGYGQQVDDVLQETFLAMYHHLKRITPVEKLRPYVFRIARNRCYDILRRQGRFEQASLDDEPIEARVSFDLFDPRDSSPEEAAHWLLLYLEVRELIEELPEVQRQTLILFAEQEMSLAEIAEIMEVSIGTVKSRLFHAKRTLRRLARPEILAALNSTLE